MKNCYEELPNNYQEVYCIDAKDKKVVIWFHIVNILLMAVVMVTCYFIKDVNLVNSLKNDNILIPTLIMLVGMVVYIILHELTHGIVYKIMTKRKLTFGMTLSVAFCGVPDVYVSKKTALFAILAPFVVFNIVYIVLLIIVPANIIAFYVILLFGIHFGGCVGDLYGTYVLLFKMSNKCLMNDTGPKQTFYEISE